MQRRKRKAGPILLMLPMAAWTVLFVGAALAYILILSFCQRQNSRQFFFKFQSIRHIDNPPSLLILLFLHLFSK